MKIALMATANEDHFKSRRTKYLFNIIDRPLIAYSIEQAAKFCDDNNDIIVISRPNAELQKVAEDLGARFVQEASAKEFFAAFGGETVLVMQADELDVAMMAMKRYDILRTLVRMHGVSETSAAYIKFDETGNPFYHIRLTKDQVDPAPQFAVPYAVRAGSFAALEELIAGNVAEPYILQYYNPFRVLSTEDIAAAASFISRTNSAGLSAGGVCVLDGATLIGNDVTAGPDVVIYPGVEITGRTHIGAGSVIRSGSRLHNMTIGENCEIEAGVLTDSTIGDDTSVGPFAYVRPGSRIGSHCRIGDFVEIKNSTIGDNSKASHLGYIGDSVVGSNVNFGCGSITVNYDGANKNTTVIEDGAFVGSNSNLVAPVRIGRGAFVAAGSTVTHDVPQDGMAIARTRQENKSGWKRPAKAK
ncbi:MAG: hypothetical protein FWD98_08560 [Defluviitaleaceae bacterium]|nr:hypothetical protein [Defluviitaleaceae bacterium]